MFTVFDPNGISRPHSVQATSSSRAVSSVEAISAIASKPHVDPEEKHKAPNPYQKLDIELPVKRILYAKDLMSSPVLTLDPAAMCKDAEKIFKEGRYHHLPIINASGRIVGIVSDRDLLNHIVHSEKGAEKTAISAIMKTNVLSAAPDTDIRSVAQVMFEEHIGSLPIIDEQFSLIGIVTRSDILRGLLRHGPVELWG